MQADVEGYEPGVLRGTKRLFLEHTVQHIFMEYSPGVAGELWFVEGTQPLLCGWDGGGGREDWAVQHTCMEYSPGVAANLRPKRCGLRTGMAGQQAGRMCGRDCVDRTAPAGESGVTAVASHNPHPTLSSTVPAERARNWYWFEDNPAVLLG